MADKDLGIVCVAETTHIAKYDHNHPIECGNRCAGPVEVTETTAWSNVADGSPIIDPHMISVLEAKRSKMIVTSSADSVYGEGG